ncbi:unnamed protein product [Allacma fusca]|uniref:Cytochrome P450 n=1 Tax=Allacma fusca TaxID=39272 RepID=A0A8J2KIV8_9HEXA|nr:unnamed protein product [Allacma fusca]
MPSLSGRPFMITHTIPSERKGLAFAEYLDNKEQRQFVLRALKGTLIKGNVLNDAIQEEVSNFVRNLKTQEGTGIQVVGLFNLAVLNSVWNCIISAKLPLDELSQILLEASNRITTIGGLLVQLGVFIPWFGSSFPNFTNIISGIEAYKDLYTFLDERIKRHRETWIKNTPRDFIDAYLDKIEETTDENSTFFAGKNFIRSTVADLFIASSDTTAAALEFSMLYLAKYSDVQKRIQDEMSEIVPILKGTKFTRPEIWQDPENFLPERFMKEDSQQKRKLLHAFSVGRRICPGDRIARDEIFMFITGILQKFDIKITSTIPSLDGEFGFARHPKPFKVTFSSRITSLDNKCTK